MWIVSLTKLAIFYSILVTTCRGSLNYVEDDFRHDTKMTRQYKTRCTRRYSPGVCANHVSPVWTFVFHEQNCTERLGCANYFRANRFKSYNICMQQCYGLVDMYLQMLEVTTNKTRSAPLRKGESPRDNPITVETEKPEYAFVNQEGLKDLTIQVYEQGEDETHSLVYKDLLNNEDIFPADVDRVDGEIRSQYDLLHP